VPTRQLFLFLEAFQVPRRVRERSATDLLAKEGHPHPVSSQARFPSREGGAQVERQTGSHQPLRVGLDPHPFSGDTESLRTPRAEEDAALPNPLREISSLLNGLAGAAFLPRKKGRHPSAISGAGRMVQMASSNTVLQTIVEEDKRGRVMSFYTVAIMGTVPFGSLLSGGLAGKLGVRETVMLGGASCVLGSLLFARRLPSLRAMVRPIYREKGILPDSPLE